MKTLSVRFRFVVIGVIAMVAVGCCCYFPFIKDTESYAYVEIGHELRGKIPRYVEWKDEGAKFKQALEQVRGHNGQYCVCVIEKPGDKPYHYPYSKCPGRYECPLENIKTVKVTKSKAAGNIAAGESAVSDPHVTHSVQSPLPGDIIKVLDALKK
jgi:hypothetical protein